jgi:hypothetical protein
MTIDLSGFSNQSSAKLGLLDVTATKLPYSTEIEVRDLMGSILRLASWFGPEESGRHEGNAKHTTSTQSDPILVRLVITSLLISECHCSGRQLAMIVMAAPRSETCRLTRKREPLALTSYSYAATLARGQEGPPASVRTVVMVFRKNRDEAFTRRALELTKTSLLLDLRQKAFKAKYTRIGRLATANASVCVGAPRVHPHKH